MCSDLPKVLHPIGGKPMLQHLLETASDLAPYRIHVITGHGKEQVMATIEQPESPLYKQLKQKNLDINWVEQSASRGAGHGDCAKKSTLGMRYMRKTLVGLCVFLNPCLHGFCRAG